MDTVQEVMPLSPLLAFNAVVSMYQEMDTGSGDLAAMLYSAGAEEGKSSHSGNSQNVRPSNSDLIVDVELSARRILNPREFTYWAQCYKSGVVVADDECIEEFILSQPEHLQYAAYTLDTRVRSKLGQRFIDIGLHPTASYLSSVDVRAPRKPKIPWSHLY